MIRSNMATMLGSWPPTLVFPALMALNWRALAEGSFNRNRRWRHVHERLLCGGSHPEGRARTHHHGQC
jgi:hypothetical protein